MTTLALAKSVLSSFTWFCGNWNIGGFSEHHKSRVCKTFPIISRWSDPVTIPYENMWILEQNHLTSKFSKIWQELGQFRNLPRLSQSGLPPAPFSVFSLPPFAATFHNQPCLFQPSIHIWMSLIPLKSSSSRRIQLPSEILLIIFCFLNDIRTQIHMLLAFANRYSLFNPMFQVSCNPRLLLKV
jgi:hypothetical protein